MHIKLPGDSHWKMDDVEIYENIKEYNNDNFLEGLYNEYVITWFSKIDFV